MAVMPGAVWRGNCGNNSGRRPGITRGAVLHVNDGPNVDLWAWVNKPSSNMSCHYQVLQDGTYFQYMDTDLWSWCQADGNAEWVSIEMPTRPGEPMTPAQIATGGRILRWLSDLYGFPLVRTDDPVNGRGLGWHGMGGSAWGGHTGCPGDIRKGQIADLLRAAAGGAPIEEDEDGMGTRTDDQIKALVQEGVRDELAKGAHSAAVEALANRTAQVLATAANPWGLDALLKRLVTVGEDTAAIRSNVLEVKARASAPATPVDEDALARLFLQALSAKLGG